MLSMVMTKMLLTSVPGLFDIATDLCTCYSSDSRLKSWLKVFPSSFLNKVLLGVYFSLFSLWGAIFIYCFIMQALPSPLRWCQVGRAIRKCLISSSTNKTKACICLINNNKDPKITFNMFIVCIAKM